MTSLWRVICSSSCFLNMNIGPTNVWFWSQVDKIEVRSLNTAATAAQTTRTTTQQRAGIAAQQTQSKQTNQVANFQSLQQIKRFPPATNWPCSILNIVLAGINITFHGYIFTLIVDGTNKSTILLNSEDTISTDLECPFWQLTKVANYEPSRPSIGWLIGLSVGLSCFFARNLGSNET